MRYSKYFKAGQKIFLRSLSSASESGRLEALTVYFQEEGADTFDLRLPYRSGANESFPFSPDMSFELLSDALGLGIRLTGSFREMRGEEIVRLQVNDDLQIFQRRFANRLDITVGLRYTKGKGTLRTFRSQWQKNVQILQNTRDFSNLPPFPRIKANLSSGGIRFRITTPVEEADLCLLILQLEEQTPPLCALAEVVWLEEEEADGRRAAGMQFLNILEADQKRIDAYIKKIDPQGGKGKPAAS